MSDYRSDIEKYRRGELSATEMHRLEKHALSDPFLSDALEGSEHISHKDLAADLNEINAAIKSRSAKRIIFSPLRIAATVILLVSVTLFVYINREKTVQETVVSENLHKEETESSAELATVESELPDPAPMKNAIAEAPVAKPESKSSDVEKIIEEPDLAALGAESVSGVVALPTQEEKEEAIVEIREIPVSKTESVASAPTRGAANNKDDAVLRQRKSISIPTTSGAVLSAKDKSPLPGVNVIIKGTPIGTISDLNGNYSIELPTNSTLVFSFIGLQSKEVSRPPAQLNVEMDVDAAQLSEVIVTGYGIQPEELANHPTLELAEPTGGRKSFNRYLEENISYPATAKEKGVEGRVTIEFIVKTNGELSDFNVVRGIGSGCDDELIRSIKEGPKWAPTKRNGVPLEEKVRVRFNFRVPK